MKAFFTLVISIAFIQYSFSQVYEIDVVDGTTVNTCAGSFQDSGGLGGGFVSGEMYSVTFCSNSPGLGISFLFTEFDIPAGSQLCVYDGPNNAAPLFGCADNTLPFIGITSTAGNTSNCLTFEFTSVNAGAGWEGVISCVTPCQTIIPKIIAYAVNGGTPQLVNPGDYIDICQGDILQIAGGGDYPQNGTFYTQGDGSSSFIWDFGDGSDPDSTGQGVFHPYNNAGGYIVQLSITDVNGCMNTVKLDQKIRVSTDPHFTGTMGATICEGDTVTLDGFAFSTEGSFAPPALFSDLLFIPDNLGTPYSTSVNVSGFNPGQQVTNLSDIIDICMNFEHSYMGDLQIEVTCPSGNSVILLSYPNTGNTHFFGEPVDGDNAGNPVAGVGYDYCFAEGAPAGDLNANVGLFTYTFTDNSGVLQTNVPYIPAGTYAPEQSLSNLLGCDLNGTWTITVVDNLLADNGTIFSWGINFDPGIYPNIEYFTPVITDSMWLSDPSIIASTDTSITIAPSGSGSFDFVYQISDDFGCIYDTTVVVTVIPSNSPVCVSCDSIFYSISPNQDTVCVGEPIQIGGEYTSTILTDLPDCNSYEISSVPFAPVSGTGDTIALIDESFSDTIAIGFPFEFYCLPYNDVYIGSNGYVTFTAPQFSTFVQFLPDPQPQNNLIAMAWGDLDPGAGGTIEYFTSGTAPNRVFVVNFTAVPFYYAAATVTSQLQLREADNSIEIHITEIDGSSFAASTIGVENINGTFGNAPPNRNALNVNVNNEAWRFIQGTYDPFDLATYAWTPAALLNDSTLANPTATVNNTTTFVVNTQFFTCEYTDSITLTTLPDLNLSTTGTSVCIGTTSGSATVTVAGGVGPYSYLWNDGQVTETAINLASANYTVTVTDDSNGCEAVATVSLPSVGLIGNTSTELSCVDGATGTATVAVTIGSGSYSYLWSTGESTEMVGSLAPGTYTVTVTDMTTGCTVSIPATVGTLTITATSSTTSSCDGAQATGTATVVASGGAGGYTYLWDDPLAQTTATASNLAVGSYTVVVTDVSGGCTVSETVSITATPLQANSLSSDACANGSLGSASVAVNGGSGTYTYLWDDPSGQTTSSASGLAAGTYNVLITDAINMCTITQAVIINEVDLTLTTSAENTCVDLSNGTTSVVVTDGAGPYSYIWSDGQTTETTTSLAVGTYTVTVTDDNGCIASSSATVEPEAYPVIDPWVSEVGTQAVTIFPEVDIPVNAGGASPETNTVYTWTGSGSTFLSSTNGNSSTANISEISQNGEAFVFNVSADNGFCVSSGTVFITTEGSEIIMPNAFYPEEATNATFGPIVEGNPEVKEFKIFNRWGQLIFDDVTTKWDGTFNGEKQPRDVYVYYVVVHYPGNPDDTVLKGDVTLIR